MKQSTKWVYFLMAFVLSTLEFGLAFSFGALFSDIRNTYLTDRPTTAAVQSLLMGIASCFCAVSGVLINKFGLHVVILMSSVFVSSGFAVSYFVKDIWYLFVTISISAGVGMSMIYVSSITLISVVFQGKQKSLSIAVHGACVPFAGLYYPYLLNILTSTYGINGTFLILGGIFCNSFAFSLMVWLRRSEFIVHNEHSALKNTHKLQTAEDQLCLKWISFFKKLITKRYICLLVGTSIAVSTSNGFLDFVFDISQWKGLNNVEARMVFVIYNCCAIAYCIMPGVLKHFLNVDIYLYSLGLAVVAFSGSLLIRFSSTFALYATGISCMAAVPGLMSSVFIICVDLVHLDQVSVAIGLLDTSIGFLSAGAGPMYGFIRDNTGSYNNIFLIIAAAQGLTALLFSWDIFSRKLNKKKLNNMDGIDNTANIEC